MIESGFYASDNGELHVVFGGKIGVCSYTQEDEDNETRKVLCFNELEDNHTIGEDLGTPHPSEVMQFHPLRLVFYDNACIDVIIDQLQQLKEV